MSHFGEIVGHDRHSLSSILQTSTRRNRNITQSLYKLIRIKAQLLGISTEFFFIWRGVQYLACHKGTNMLAIYNNRSTKIHKAGMTLINIWLATAHSYLAGVLSAFNTATLTFGSTTNLLHAEICPVSRPGN